MIAEILTTKTANIPKRFKSVHVPLSSSSPLLIVSSLNRYSEDASKSTERLEGEDGDEERSIKGQVGKAFSCIVPADRGVIDLTSDQREFII